MDKNIALSFVLLCMILFKVHMLHKMEIVRIFQEDILIERVSLSELLLYKISTLVQSNKFLENCT